VARILVAGLVHVQTATSVVGFPLEYAAVQYPRQGIQTTVSGASVHVSRALRERQDNVVVASFIGRDHLGAMVKASLDAEGISTALLNPALEQTQQSIVLSDDGHQRQFFIDLKESAMARYPKRWIASELRECAAVALCDFRFSARIIEYLKGAEIPIALFLEGAVDEDEEVCRRLFDTVNIVFAPFEGLPGSPEQWIRGLRDDHQPNIVIVSLGAQGALIWVREDNFIERICATGEMVDGPQRYEELFAAFIHHLCRVEDPYTALEKALTATPPELSREGIQRNRSVDHAVDPRLSPAS
jgi:acarbose 7IV-phosphotransferase